MTLTEQLRTVAVQQDSLRVQLSDALQGRVTSAPDAAAQPSAAEQRMQDMWAEMDKSWQAINQMLRQHTPGAASTLPILLILLNSPHPLILRWSRCGWRSSRCCTDCLGLTSHALIACVSDC